MATSLGSLTLKLVADLAGYTTPLEKAASKTKTHTRGMQKQFDDFGSSIKRVALAAGAGLAFKAIIDNTIEAEKATSKLNVALTATGRYTPELSAQMLAYSAALQQVSTFGDEAITASQTVLAGFTSIGGPVFQRAQEAILDVASALGKDLPGAARTVGLALEDPIKGIRLLRQLNVVLSESQKELIKDFEAAGDRASAQGVILDELNGKYAGSAAAARDTLGGALAALKESFGNLLEGDASGPGGLADSINGLNETMNSAGVKAGFAAFVGGLTTVAGKSAEAIAGLSNLSRFIGESFARATGSLAIGDLAGIDDKLAGLIKKRDHLEKMSWYPGKSGVLDGLNAEIEKTQKLLDLSKEMGKTPAGPGPINVPNVPAVIDTSAVDAERKKEAEKAAKALFKQNQSSVDALKIQAATLGKTSEEVELYRLSLNGANAAQLASAETSVSAISAYEAQKKATEDAANAAEKLFEANQSAVDGMAFNAAVIGKSAAEIEIYRLSLNKASEAQLAQAQAALSTTEAYEAQKKATEAAADIYKSNIELLTGLDAESQAYGKTMDDLNALLEAGAINQQDYIAAVEKLGPTLDKMNTFADQAARNLQDTFSQILFDPFENGLDGMISSFGDMLRQLVAQAVAADLLHAIGLGGAGNNGGNVGVMASGLGRLFGGLFGGGRANGGPVTAGVPYLVGERRPEIFIPNSSGRILPNTSGLSGGTVVNVQNIAQGGSVETSQEKGPDGSIMIKNWFRAELKDAFASGSMDKVMAPMGARRRGY